MKLYYDPCTVNCRKVLAGFDLLGMKYDTVKIDYFTQGQKSPDYLAVNPNGSLPALDDDGFVLWESNAMLQYAADKMGAEAYYPKDPKTRADIHRWHLWESSAWFPSCYVYLVENVVKPLLKAEPDQSILMHKQRTSTCSPAFWISAWLISPGCAVTASRSPTSRSPRRCICIRFKSCRLINIRI